MWADVDTSAYVHIYILMSYVYYLLCDSAHVDESTLQQNNWRIMNERYESTGKIIRGEKYQVTNISSVG